jgi:predicted Rossmann fold nucleotide-binding protein DprA/Smf involved in DNA uptake
MHLKGFKIVSGGQTGADRAALDFAIAHGIPHGGWCPKGRKSEDGQLASGYKLEETPRSNYTQRTEGNVRDSDGTVIFPIGSGLTGGSLKTFSLAEEHGKPVLHIARDQEGFPEQQLIRFIRSHQIKALNVAGPRASKEPDVAGFVTEVLTKALLTDDS